LRRGGRRDEYRLATTLPRDRLELLGLAGLLQNVGMVLIAVGLPAEYLRITMACRAGVGSLVECEAKIAGVSHADLSGEALSCWHLPAPIAEAVRWHHGPHPPDKTQSLSALVELADYMAGQQGILAQPWMRAADGTPEEALETAGLGGKAAALMGSFRAEFDAIKVFFR